MSSSLYYTGKSTNIVETTQAKFTIIVRWQSIIHRCLVRDFALRGKGQN